MGFLLFSTAYFESLAMIIHKKAAMPPHTAPSSANCVLGNGPALVNSATPPAPDRALHPAIAPILIRMLPPKCNFSNKEDFIPKERCLGLYIPWDRELAESCDVEASSTIESWTLLSMPIIAEESSATSGSSPMYPSGSPKSVSTLGRSDFCDG